jgi:hypothetical protein
MLTPTSQLLPDFYMKSRISERARPCDDGSAWMAQNYFDTPLGAFVEEVAGFPYIGADGACFRIMNDLLQAAHELVVLIQASCVGYPLAVACWFEYADRDLKYAEWENIYTWLLSEIPLSLKTAGRSMSKGFGPTMPAIIRFNRLGVSRSCGRWSGSGKASVAMQQSTAFSTWRSLSRSP